MAQRKAITRKLATRYAKASKVEKVAILDEACELCDYVWTALLLYRRPGMQPDVGAQD